MRCTTGTRQMGVAMQTETAGRGWVQRDLFAPTSRHDRPFIVRSANPSSRPLPHAGAYVIVVLLVGMSTAVACSSSKSGEKRSCDRESQTLNLDRPATSSFTIAEKRSVTLVWHPDSPRKVVQATSSNPAVAVITTTPTPERDAIVCALRPGKATISLQAGYANLAAESKNIRLNIVND